MALFVMMPTFALAAVMRFAVLLVPAKRRGQTCRDVKVVCMSDLSASSPSLKDILAITAALRFTRTIALPMQRNRILLHAKAAVLVRAFPNLTAAKCPALEIPNGKASSPPVPGKTTEVPTCEGPLDE